MDVETAINHRQRLQGELETIRRCPLLLPISRKLLAIEIARLDHKIPSEYMRSVTNVSEIKIPVDNRLLVLQLSLDFRLSGVSSLRDFIKNLCIEMCERVSTGIGLLPLTNQFTWSVIRLLEDEITQQQESERLSFEAPPARNAG